MRNTAQREHREAKSGQAELIFEPTGAISQTKKARGRRLDEARERLFAILQRGPILYEYLQPRILEIPYVWNADLNTILLTAQKDGHLEIEGIKTNERTPKNGCLVRLRS